MLARSVSQIPACSDIRCSMTLKGGHNEKEWTKTSADGSKLMVESHIAKSADPETDDASSASDASILSESSASVSIATDASGSNSDGNRDGSDDNVLGRAVSLSGGAVRLRSQASHEEERESDVPQRRAPARSKSGERLIGGGRRPPARTKSGEISKLAVDVKNRLAVGSDDDEIPRNKDEALKRNAARRQKSSEMLLAMRDATRNPPSRTRSGSVDRQRRPPARTKSGSADELSRDGDSKRPGPRRRPPPRTKSGDGLR